MRKQFTGSASVSGCLQLICVFCRLTIYFSEREETGNVSLEELVQFCRQVPLQPKWGLLFLSSSTFRVEKRLPCSRRHRNIPVIPFASGMKPTNIHAGITDANCNPKFHSTVAVWLRRGSNT